MKNTVNAATLPMSKELSLFQRSANNSKNLYNYTRVFSLVFIFLYH